MGCSSISGLPEPLTEVPRLGVNPIASYRTSSVADFHTSGFSAPATLPEVLVRVLDWQRLPVYC